MKTLAYFGCGIETMDFSDFQYDRIILIDYHLKIHNKNFEEVIENKIIIKMACAALDALAILKQKNIKLDCYISINEGLREGSGDYPLNSSYFLSYLAPVLNDTYYHIYAPRYYGKTDLTPLCNKKNFKNSSFYILSTVSIEATGVIASKLNNGENFPLKSYLLQRRSDIVVFDDPNANFKIINGNIWEHEADLDVLFLTLNEKYSPFLNNLKKIEWFEKGVFPFDKLENLKMKEVKKIGIIPWYSENYIEELTKIMGFAEKNSIEITLFFVDKNDQILFENIIQNTF